jgi:small-conductance mechanosensitive channel
MDINQGGSIMLTTDAFFSMNSDIILMLAIAVLVAKCMGLLFSRSNRDLTLLKINLLLIQQPWLPALVIILNFIGAYLLNNFSAVVSEHQQLYSGILKGQDILQSIFSLYLLLAEAKAIYTWLGKIALNRPVLQTLLPYLKNSLYFMGLILAVPFIIPNFLQSASLDTVISKATGILIIWTIAWIVIQIIVGFEKITLERFNQDLNDNFRARRLYTQARLFKRLAMIVVFVLATAMSAMIFDNIREIGTSILASAGLATIILGFAAQKTLGSLFAGIQIAITQPIRINDTVTLENEFGTVEEISLTYVIIRIWDLRRLIVPINYFLEKPFQNLSHSSTNLLCPIIFCADYNLPVAAVREKFLEILKASAFWDGKVANLQVTDAKEGVIQLRALASAKDSSSSWNLRCEVLEKLIGYLNEHFPESLPKMRNLVSGS